MSAPSKKIVWHNLPPMTTMGRAIINELYYQNNKPMKPEDSEHFSAAMLFALNRLVNLSIIEYLNNGKRYRLTSEAYNDFPRL